MKTHLLPKREMALTMIEVLMIVAGLLIIGIILLPKLARNRARIPGISCANNLKQIGLAFKIWAGDNNDKYPMQVSTNDGGTMEFVGTPETFRHFQVMSNELNTPKMLICPWETDRARVMATAFQPGSSPYNTHPVLFAGNSNLSYFAGVDASQTNATIFLVGDRNIRNGIGTRNSLLSLGTNQAVGWTKEMHGGHGNICFADGGVAELDTPGLRGALKKASPATTRLQMP